MQLMIHLGRFCFSLFAFLVGLGRILLWATKTTCFPENFFSSSLTNLILQDKGEVDFKEKSKNLVWIFWKALS